MKTLILILLTMLAIPVQGQTDNVTLEKNQLNRELFIGGNSPERVKEIKKRLWELDEEYFQKKFNQAGKSNEKSDRDMKVLCTQYTYRRTELDRGVSSGYIEQDSKAASLYVQYENGIRENCKH